MTSHTIRLAQPSDAAAVCHLNRECMGYDYPLRATAQKLQNSLANGRCRIFVAELDGQVVGYVHAQDYDVLYFDHMKNILGIAVDPAFRRQGIGRALLNAVEEWGGNRVHALSGWSAAWNEPARISFTSTAAICAARNSST